MKLTREQTKALLSYVASTESDETDCEGCFEHLAEFVELELLGSEMPAALEKIERHIDQCACCQDEHNALKEALQAINDE